MNGTRAMVRAVVILALAGFAVYAFNRGREGDQGGKPGGSLFAAWTNRIFGDGSYGLFDRLYVCIPGNLKAAWDDPGDPSLDSDTREWIGVHRTRVAVITKSLGYTKAPSMNKLRIRRTSGPCATPAELITLFIYGA